MSFNLHHFCYIQQFCAVYCTKKGKNHTDDAEILKSHKNLMNQISCTWCIIQKIPV